MDATRFTVLTALALAAGTTAAQSLTVVNQPWPGESTHAQMLAEAFGGSFSSMGQVTGVNAKAGQSNLVDIGYTNGSYTFTRVADMGGSAGNVSLKNLMGGGDDDMWRDGSYRATSLGGYSSLSHEFGYIGANGEYHTIVAEGVSALENSIHPNEDFTWAIRTSNGREYNSNEMLNGSGADHMVTYAMYDDSNTLIGAVLFFEDWAGGNSDYDYNDYAVMLTLAPTPQAALLGLLGLGGVAAGRRRRTIA
ncbi:MAG TPA: DUF4114 domain-containing protein [Phycisphaerales bacterium]|nr:DUF4114 domain-containing protein [Phycisphaerales bacterium]